MWYFVPALISNILLRCSHFFFSKLFPSQHSNVTACSIVYRYSHGFVPAVIPWIVSGFYFTLVTQVPILQPRCGFHVKHTINTQTTGRSSSARLPLPRNSPLVSQPDRPRHGFQVAVPSKQTPSRTQHTPRCSHSHFLAPPSPALCPRFGTSSPVASTLKVSTTCCPACIIVTTLGEPNIADKFVALFPAKTHVIARLYPEFLNVCARHGVQPKNARNAAVFVRGYLEWISSLSREQM